MISIILDDRQSAKIQDKVVNSLIFNTMAYFDKYGVEYSDDRKTLVRCPEDFKGKYVIPNSVTIIGENAFRDCNGLTSVIIPDGVISIGNHAFFSCEGLTSITIGNCVKSIEKDAFTGNSGLMSINVGKLNPTYDSRENCNAIIETATNALILGCQKTIIPNNVTSIEEGAFWFCSNLVSIHIPDSVTKIGRLAFSDCNKLTYLTIGNGVTSIGNESFNFCNLKNIVLGASVNQIGAGAFENNLLFDEEYVHEYEPLYDDNGNVQNTIKTITCYNPNPPSVIGELCNNDLWKCDFPYSSVILLVPRESVEAYKNNPAWNKFDIRVIEE